MASPGKQARLRIATRDTRPRRLLCSAAAGSAGRDSWYARDRETSVRQPVRDVRLPALDTGKLARAKTRSERKRTQPSGGAPSWSRSNEPPIIAFLPVPYTPLSPVSPFPILDYVGRSPH